MFEHIRRAAAWAIRLRLLTPRADSTRTEAWGPDEQLVPFAYVPPVPLRRPRKHTGLIRAEDNDPVRPYVLTSAERAQRWGWPSHRTLLVHPSFSIAEGHR